MHHRSVAKTRNQLDRIAYKITQLKEKHTLDTVNTLESNGWLQNKRRGQSGNSKRLKPDYYKESKSSMFNTQKFQKHEIVEYPDKYENEQPAMYSLRINKSNSMEERIKKIQEDVTRVMSMTQDVIVKLKRNENEFDDRINQVQNKVAQKIASTSIQKIQSVVLQQNQTYTTKLTQLESQINAIDEAMNKKIIEIQSSTQLQQIQERMNQIEDFVSKKEEQQEKYQKYLSNVSKIQQEYGLKLEQIQEKMEIININQIKEQLAQIQTTLNSSESQEKVTEKINHLKEQFNKYLNTMNEHIAKSDIEMKDQLLNQIEMEMKGVQGLINEHKQTYKKQYENIVKLCENREMHTSESKQTIEENNSSIDCLDRKLQEFESNLNQVIKNFYIEFQQKLEENQQYKEIFITLEDKVTSHMSAFQQLFDNLNLKVQKLNHNIDYVNEKMSKIQYDNANFKDQLMMEKRKQSPSKSIYWTPQKSVSPHQNQSGNSSGMLDALEQFSSRGFFAQQDF